MLVPHNEGTLEAELEKRWLAMLAASGTVRAPLNLQRGVTRDISHVPYADLWFMAIVTTAVSAFFIFGLVFGSVLGVLVCSFPIAITVPLMFFVRSFTVEFDKPSQMMHITKRRLLLHCCPTRLDLPFAAPVSVMLRDTGMRIGAPPNRNRIMAVRLSVQDVVVDVQHGVFDAMYGCEVDWTDYLKAIGVQAALDRPRISGKSI